MEATGKRQRVRVGAWRLCCVRFACVPCICVGPRLSCVISLCLSLSACPRPGRAARLSAAALGVGLPAPRAGPLPRWQGSSRSRAHLSDSRSRRRAGCALWALGCLWWGRLRFDPRLSGSGLEAPPKAQGHNHVRRYRTYTLYPAPLAIWPAVLSAAIAPCRRPAAVPPCASL